MVLRPLFTNESRVSSETDSILKEGVVMVKPLSNNPEQRSSILE